MIKKVHFLNMCFLAALIITAQAETMPRTLSLKDALEIAQQRDIRFILSDERVNQAISRIAQSRAPLLPQVSIDVSQKRQTRDLRTAGIEMPGDPLVGPFNTFDARIKLTQMIFDAGTVNRLKTAQAQGALSVAERRKVEEDVLVLIAQLYIDARRSIQTADFAKTMVERDLKKLDIAKSRLENGIGSDIDVRQAKTAYDTALSFQQQVYMHAVESRLDLLAALGLSLDDTIQFIDDNGINFPEPEENIQTSFEELPDIQVAKQQLRFSEAQLESQRSEYLPNISGIADFGPSGIDPSDTNNTFTVGVQASLPIFDGGLRRAQVDEAISQVKYDQANLNHNEFQFQAKIIKARELFEQTQFIFIEKTSRQEMTQQELLLVQQRVKDGTATEIELLEAIALDAQARNDADEAKAAVLTAQINWNHALGKLSDVLNESIKPQENHP
ncbi:MAG: TolC family protein [Candidatus Omnitrophica bacterium]|nr:TolC family protein [Candidatus Omnitrophota bacterium]